MPVESGAVASGQAGHDFQDERRFHGGKPGFDSARDIETSGAPVCEGKCGAGGMRSERDDEKIAGITAEGAGRGALRKKLEVLRLRSRPPAPAGNSAQDDGVSFCATR
jgi:hypothetical protein